MQHLVFTSDLSEKDLHYRAFTFCIIFTIVEMERSERLKYQRYGLSARPALLSNDILHIPQVYVGEFFLGDFLEQLHGFEACRRPVLEVMVREKS